MIEGLTIFNHYLYPAYADNINFFKKCLFYKAYGWKLLFFSYFSALKSNLTISEIAGIRVLKGIQVAVYGMHCIDLNKYLSKLLDTHFPYYKKWKRKKNVWDCNRYSTNIENMGNEKPYPRRENQNFQKKKKKSKIVFQSFITTALKLIVKELQKTQKAFSWKKPTPNKKTFQ